MAADDRDRGQSGKTRPWSSGLLADELNDNLPLTRPRVELQQHDLLPRPQHQSLRGEWNRDRRTNQRLAHVARAVVVVPAQMVPILPLTRSEVFQRAVEI